MQATGTRQTDVSTEVERIAGCGQPALGIFDSEELQKTFRADTSPACEQALEVMFTESDVTGNCGEFGLRVCMRLQIGQGISDAAVIRFLR
jgi:hypothetical protein